MASNDRGQENATISAEPSRTQTEPGQVRGVQEKSPTDIVTRIRELLRELDDHAYIGENGYNRIRNSLVLNIRRLDAAMANGGGFPEQWRIERLHYGDSDF